MEWGAFDEGRTTWGWNGGLLMRVELPGMEWGAFDEDRTTWGWGGGLS